MPLNLKLNECIVNMNEFGIESFHESIKKNFLIFLITTFSEVWIDVSFFGK